MLCLCFSWSSYRASSLPPLDWPLPNQYGQFELKIEVHPKAHHRAHYETEGSRGAIKATSGGHPIVKVSIRSGLPTKYTCFSGGTNPYGLLFLSVLLTLAAKAGTKHSGRRPWEARPHRKSLPCGLVTSLLLVKFLLLGERVLWCQLDLSK